ncbi:uncharacterized protein LOC132933592 [Metopolophium dirhodum]|uniref:uncharacterized protein LOC132933592 n=1 Tax=Metopolophium dirhodum TaxID=44670 RepID=UPI002990247C|nr:uncharacterized protein LOC132933592 [Metopolophium dirhodum]
MLLCLLFQIRSPTGYKFLKDQNILPLPCVSTIRKNLLAIKIVCGFDPNLFKLLKMTFSTKSEHKKKGIILLDEMFLRESLSVNSRSLTNIGLEDFRNEELVRKNSNLKANHGLVFMWQSLAENMVQPITVFASAGPVKGVELSKLIVKAILLMEDAGAHVVGITCDGASTNRTMWNSLGVSAKKDNFKNYF